MTGDITSLLLKIAEIIWINVLLSGDNAVVIALACRGLPEDKRKIGIMLGAGAAIGLRILFTLVVVQLLALPYVKLVSGILLVWIAIKLIIDDDAHAKVTTSATIWKAVRTIAIADAIMSLDNVVAIAAVAQGSLLLIVIGLLISIPLIVFGSTMVLALINRFPAIIWLGSAMLGWVAAELLISDPWIIQLLGDMFHKAEPWAGPVGAVVTVAVAWLATRGKAAEAG